MPNRQRAAVACSGSLDPVLFVLLLIPVCFRLFVAAWAAVLHVALSTTRRFVPLVLASALPLRLLLAETLRLAPLAALAPPPSAAAGPGGLAPVGWGALTPSVVRLRRPC